MIREYKTIREISGPLMVVDHVQGVTYDELAEIVLSDGSTRRCKVLEVNGDRAVVQLFESSAGINLADSRIRFLGHPLQLAVSRDMLGRVFNGMGQPIDGGPEIIADEHRDINGLAMNPAARNYNHYKEKYLANKEDEHLLEQAEEDYQNAIACAKDKHSAYFEISRFYEDVEKFEEARLHCSGMVTRVSTSPPRGTRSTCRACFASRNTAWFCR